MSLFYLNCKRNPNQSQSQVQATKEIANYAIDDIILYLEVFLMHTLYKLI